MVFLSIVGVAALAAHPDCGHPARALPQPVRGLVLSLHDASPERSYRAAVREVAASGVNAISVLPTWDMADIHAAEVEPGSATVPQIEDAIAEARASGLEVLLAPVIRLRRLGEKEWRGVLAPRDWNAWFQSYGERLLDLARLGERYDVAALIVGSELCSSERREREWRHLIAEVRRVFRGSLLYQANWDQTTTARFYDDLDLLGVNAYFELAKLGEQPSVAALAASWAPHRRALLEWAAANRRELVITEVGYPSTAGAAAYPWDYTRDAPVDLEMQRRAYAAFLQVWMAPGSGRGFFIYEWWGEGGARDRGYTPRGKPALEVLRLGLARENPPGADRGGAEPRNGP